MNDENRRLLGLLEDNLQSAEVVGRRLARYYDHILPFYPLTTDFLAKAAATLDDAAFAMMDGLIKKFEQLLTLQQDSLFKTIATLDNDASVGGAKRDLTNYMERISVVASSKQYSEIVMLRNRVAHEYPNNPEKQARLMNEVVVATQVLLQVMKNIQSYCERRRPVWSNLGNNHA